MFDFRSVFIRTLSSLSVSKTATRIGAVLLLTVFSTTLAGAPLDLQQQDIFISGKGGYHTYRIPSLVVTQSGSLLAFCEGRKNGDSDRGDIDLLLRRSFDNGQTWSPVQTVWDDGEHTCGNPCAVVDEAIGVIWLLMTWNSGELQRESDVQPGFGEDSRRVFVTHSSDDGLTWAAPKELTRDVKRETWSWFATGPGAGIQIRNGPYRGRLVIPCDHKVPVDSGVQYFSHIIYSDDHGQTWQLGGDSPQGQVNECEVVELSDGRLLLNMRNYRHGTHTRQICFSRDGGLTWTDQQHDETLIEPICQASIRRYAWPEGDHPGMLLFSNPACTSARWNLTVRASLDEGKTWPHARVLFGGAAAYSCLNILPDGTIACLFEKNEYRQITFACFSRQWLLNEEPESEPQPNIILIVADDLGYGDLGCYGNSRNWTPHIDALAGAGLRFTDFHSAGPMCTPTRAAMLTGLYQQRFGHRFDGPLSGKTDRDKGLPLKAVTIAEILKEHGYVTACFGKWHLGYEPPFLPPDQGFDEFRGLTSGDGDHHTHINRWGREDWWHNHRIEMADGYCADLLTEYSIDFIERHRERPFFLYVPHLAIHFPWQGPDDPPHRVKGQIYEHDKWGLIPNPDQVHPHVRAMIESLDKSTGKIVAALERLQLRQRTLVIFSSDNGGYLSYGDRFHNISSNGPLRGQKGTLYEGGHRVPMIMSYPGTIEPGITHGLAHSVDLLPTFASLASARIASLQSDGINLSPLLQHDHRLPRRQFFWRSGSQKAVRNGPWKLCITEQGTELFHLHRNLGEEKNLAESYPEIVQNLTRNWHAWETEVNRSAVHYQQ